MNKSSCRRLNILNLERAPRGFTSKSHLNASLKILLSFSGLTGFSTMRCNSNNELTVVGEAEVFVVGQQALRLGSTQDKQRFLVLGHLSCSPPLLNLFHHFYSIHLGHVEVYQDELVGFATTLD